MLHTYTVLAHLAYAAHMCQNYPGLHLFALAMFELKKTGFVSATVSSSCE